MAEYTETQLVAKIQAIDTEIEKHLLSTATGGPAVRAPLDYKLGEKTIWIKSRIELLQKQREVYVKHLESIGAGVNEVATPPDYQMADTGEQLGDVVTGNE